VTVLLNSEQAIAEDRATASSRENSSRLAGVARGFLQILQDSATNGIAAQSGRGLLWLVVMFAAGIALYFTWQVEPSAALGPGIAVAGIVSAYLLRSKVSPMLLALAVVALGLGHSVAQFRAWSVAAPILQEEIGPLIIEGRVATAERRPSRNRIIIEDFSLPNLSAEDTPKKLRISLPASHGLPNVGDRISVRAIV